jgi:hypothetical protein
MNATLRPVVGASLAAVCTLASLCADGLAAEPAKAGGRVSWWVEGRPWNCADPVAPVARQAGLACDASGGHCRIARTREEADRIAALTCAADGSAWRLDAEDRSGRVLWWVTLTGDEESRARRAGLWIARAEEESGPPAAQDEPAVTVAPPPAPEPPAPAPPASDAAPANPAPPVAPEAPAKPAPPHPRERTNDEREPHREKPFRRMWVGLTGSIDFFAIPGSTDVCALDPATQGTTPLTKGNPYQCVDVVTAQPFPADSTTNHAILQHGDLVQSGFAPGNRRVLVSFDYAVTPNLLVGARIGYAIPVAPSFVRTSPLQALHVEGRVTYLFGDDAVSQTFAPMLFAATGLGEFDAFVEVPVFLNNGQPGTQEVAEQAWITAGPAFIAAGGGARLLLFDSFAATGALKFEGAFGGSAHALFGAAPELGVQVGF